MTGDRNLPEQWEADPYWRAAVCILDGFDSGVWRHVTPAGIDFPSILGHPWSAGEERILLAAGSLFNGFPVSLTDLAAGLDDKHWQILIHAIDILREGLR